MAELTLKEINKIRSVDQKVTTLINNNMLGVVFDLQASGCKLSKKQQEDFDEKIKEESFNDGTTFLQELLQKGYRPRNEVVMHWLLDPIMSAKAIEFTNKYLNNKWTEKSFVTGLIKQWTERLQEAQKGLIRKGLIKAYSKEYRTLEIDINTEYHTAKSTEYEQLIAVVVKKLFSKIEKTMTLNDYLSAFKLLKQSEKIKYQMFIDKALNIMEIFHKDSEEYKLLMSKKPEQLNSAMLPYREKHKFQEFERDFRSPEIKLLIGNMAYQIKEEFKNDKEDLFKKIEFQNMSKIIKTQMVENAIKEANELDLNQLPSVGSDILKEIHQKITNCFKDRELLGELKWKKVEKLWQQHIPEILQTYLRVDYSYRTSLKNNDGKTPEEMMISGLQSINRILNDEIIVYLNQQRMKSLSMNQKYTMEVKNNLTKKVIK